MMTTLPWLSTAQGELGEAERLYQEVLAIDPSHSGALTNMGNVRLLQNRLQEAADYYSAVERAASKQGGHIAAANRRSGMFNLAQALKQVRPWGGGAWGSAHRQAPGTAGSVVIIRCAALAISYRLTPVHPHHAPCPPPRRTGKPPVPYRC